MIEHRGILKHNSDVYGDALFELEGQEGEFNNNYIKEMAVKDSALSERFPTYDFGAEYRSIGWVPKNEDNTNHFTPDNLNGKEVAFRSKDPESGKLVEHHGVLKHEPGSYWSALFELEGQEGEFNNNYIKEMAVKGSAASERFPTNDVGAESNYRLGSKLGTHQ